MTIDARRKLEPSSGLFSDEKSLIANIESRLVVEISRLARNFARIIMHASAVNAKTRERIICDVSNNRIHEEEERIRFLMYAKRANEATIHNSYTLMCCYPQPRFCRERPAISVCEESPLKAEIQNRLR